MIDWQAAINSHLCPFITHQRAGLITDVDGTISPIVPHPDDAVVSERSKALLTALGKYLNLTGVISGRAAADIHERVGVPGLVYVGNHGLERWVDGQVQPDPSVDAYLPAIQTAKQEIERHLHPRMWIEDKVATLSVHYRQADNPDRIARDLAPQMQQIAAAHGLRFFEGRRIFEIRPPIAINKGTAFRHLIQEYALDAAIYIGDDVTDADALQAARDLRSSGSCYALGVGVESEATPSVVSETSDLSASGISGVEALLAWLLSAFKESSTCA